MPTAKKKKELGDETMSPSGALIIEESSSSSSLELSLEKKRKRAADSDDLAGAKKKKKEKKKKKKEKKKKKKSKSKSEKDQIDSDDGVGVEENDTKEEHAIDANHHTDASTLGAARIVTSSALEFYDDEIKRDPDKQKVHSLTLLLFYQYVEPNWDERTYQMMLNNLKGVGKRLKLTGRMRVAKEGLNCTLTGTHDSIIDYCKTLLQLRPRDFQSTEFKLTCDLPKQQAFTELKVIPVIELVHYGLEKEKAPPIKKFQGVHLEPKEYHQKLAEDNTVIIDVRNHYEAAIGRFVPPSNGPKYIDPMMRKSTEFPVWLDKKETREEMKGKQVLMYCTGGIRCERASALLKYKMETDPEIKDLGIKGVYQLQGGIDKYFKEFPDGGYWQGKNYVFDKRFAQCPPKVDGELHGKTSKPAPKPDQLMGKCSACQKPWDLYRNKRRCPTCGSPMIICKDCFLADKNGSTRFGKAVRCDLCVSQGIQSKQELRAMDQQQIREYEERLERKGLLKPEEATTMASNPENITRLVLKNMCKSNMTEESLLETIPGITHIVWKTDRQSGSFLGQGWVEMSNPDFAARAVARDGKISLFGRKLYISFQPPDPKDLWPPPGSAVSK